jgi:hypothetical protein
MTLQAKIVGYFTDKVIDVIIFAILLPILTAVINRVFDLTSLSSDLVLFSISAIGIIALGLVFLSGYANRADRGRIITHESTTLRITKKESKVAVSRDYVFLEKPRYTREFIEAEDDKVKAFGANGLGYESEDSEVEKFKPMAPNRYVVYWKPRHEILPYSVYRHTYEYKPPISFIHGVRYIFTSSNFSTGYKELEVESFQPFAQVECFATRRHFNDAEELAEAVLFHPTDLTILKQDSDEVRNKARIAVPNPQLGLNYYIAWSHDGPFREIWRKHVEEELKRIGGRRRKYLSPRYYRRNRNLRKLVEGREVTSAISEVSNPILSPKDSHD